MRLRTVRYIIKEGLSNVLRNKLMFFACCAIVTTTLTVLGILMLLILNIERNVEMLNEIPQIQVYCEYDLPDGEVARVEEALRESSGIKEFVFVSKQEAFEKTKEMLGDYKEVIDGFGDDFLPASFIVRMERPDLVEEFVALAEAVEGVDKVNYPKKTIDFFSSISRWLSVFSFILVTIPMIFAYFIVLNTIKLAVAERKTEISIMRYIGATEQIIKWPFVVEGVLIGLVGASIAYMLTGHGYSIVESHFNTELVNLAIDQLRMVKIGNVSTILLLINIFIGVGVGALGSVQSIRKYLRV